MRAPLAGRAEEATAGYRWVVLGIVYPSLLAFAAVFQSLPPLLSLLLADLHLSHTEAGLLMSLFALPGVFLSVPAGLSVDRYGVRSPMLLSLAAMIVGSLLVAVGQEWSILALGRLVAGAGGGALFVMSAAYVAAWFPVRQLGVAMGSVSTTMPVGMVLTLNLLGTVAAGLGWRGALLLAIAPALVAVVAFGLLYRPPPPGRLREAPLMGQATLGSILGLGVPIWLVGGIWLLTNAALIAFLTFGPDYFMTRGYGVGVASFLASILMLPSPLLAPGVGYLVDRLGREELLLGLGGLSVAGSMLAIAAASLPLAVPLVLLGVGVALVPPPIFALPSKRLPPQRVGAGYGIVSTCLNVGVVAGPYVSGVARDLTGAYQLSFSLLAGFALMAALLAGVLARARQPRSRGWAPRGPGTAR